MAELDTTWLDPRDRSYAESRDTGEREVVLSTVIRYRRPDQVRAGDALPELELARLDDGATVRLDTLAEERPVVLVFGSYT